MGLINRVDVFHPADLFIPVLFLLSGRMSSPSEVAAREISDSKTSVGQ
jgi:hypothetical protein